MVVKTQQKPRCQQCDRRMKPMRSSQVRCGLCLTYKSGKLVMRNGALIAVGAKGLFTF